MKLNKQLSFKRCESEGCVIYPSIISTKKVKRIAPQKRVTKIYHTPNLYYNELDKYVLFDTIDQTYSYHPRHYVTGFRIFKPDLQKKYYIDFEYVGQNLTEIKIKNYHLITLVNNYLTFISQILQIKNQSNDYFVNRDIHSGNVCINNQHIIKLIDLSNIEFINQNTIFQENTNILSQFSCIIGTLRILFLFLQSEDATLYLYNMQQLKALQDYISLQSTQQNQYKLVLKNVLKLLSTMELSSSSSSATTLNSSVINYENSQSNTPLKLHLVPPLLTRKKKPIRNNMNGQTSSQYSSNCLFGGNNEND